jgi:hypothetical protein
VTIEVTDEMREAFERAAGECAGIDVRGGLTAVLAIVERERVILPREAPAVRRDRVEPEGLRDSLGTACASCGHPRNFHEYSDLICVVKLDQHGFARCGCVYRSPNAQSSAT